MKLGHVVSWIVGASCFSLALYLLTGSALAGLLLFIGGIHQMHLGRQR
jgi:hypothetical protein